MSPVEELEGLLTAYRLASAAESDAWSPIEAMRQEQRAAEAAREIANLLAAVGLPGMAVAR